MLLELFINRKKDRQKAVQKNKEEVLAKYPRKDVELYEKLEKSKRKLNGII